MEGSPGSDVKTGLALKSRACNEKCSRADSSPGRRQGREGPFYLQNGSPPSEVTRKISVRIEVIRVFGGSHRSHECISILLRCSAITEECCFDQLTSTLTAAASQEPPACGQTEILSRAGSGPALNIGPAFYISSAVCRTT